jgi:ATP-binding protein involved in chromosome partitioning
MPVGHIFKAEAVLFGVRAGRPQFGPHSSTGAVLPPMSDQSPPVESPAVRPTVDAVRGMLGGVMDPELKASIVDLGMVHDVSVAADGVVTVHIALTTLGCPLQAEIRREIQSKLDGLPGVGEVKVRWVEMSQEQKSAAMQRARLNARENAPDTQIPVTTRVLTVSSGKGGVGKSSVSVNLAAALAARGLRVGVLDADIWGFSVPRMLGIDGRLRGEDGKIVPHHREIDGGGSLEIVSMGFLVEDESTALMWRGLILTKAVEQFLTDVRWGELDYLIVDMPPGTGDVQMGLARLLPQAEMLVVTTPARNAQKVATRVADMARRSYMKVVGVVENMSEFVAPDGQRFALFGRGGGAALAEEIGAPLVASIPLEPEVSEGGDTGQPIALSSPESPAGAAFHTLAARIVDELLPPVEMAGCTARIFELANATLAAADAAKA